MTAPEVVITPKAVLPADDFVNQVFELAVGVI